MSIAMVLPSNPKNKSMKNFAFACALASCSMMSMAQLGTAPDFNVTDIDGNTHQLYADILDQGLIAIVDVSNTWCHICWNFHSSHALEDLNQAYGPNGTDQLRVIFYEADPNTTIQDIQGMTSGSQGDWTNGVSYPIVNESPLQLDLSIWAPFGTPSVNVIRPSDYEIILRTGNLPSFQAQADAINGADIDGIVLGVANTSEVAKGTAKMEVFPNPSLGAFTLSLEGFTGMTSVEVYNLVGQQVWSVKALGSNRQQQVDLRDLEGGHYLLRASDGVHQVTQRVTLLD
jgi:hypothetical protein